MKFRMTSEEGVKVAATPMTEEDYHKVKAEIAMTRFQGVDNPFTGEVGIDGVKLRRRGYFEIANEITDEEVQTRWASTTGQSLRVERIS